MSIIAGTSGDDILTGTDDADTFQVWDKGNETLSGLDGDDLFIFRHSLTAADAVDGGVGNDRIWISGAEYSDGLTFGAVTLTSVEMIQTAAGHDYSLTTVDANVAAGDVLTINGINLDTGNALTFDGSAETDGSFKLIGGAGDDQLTGGANADIFVLWRDGADTAHGGGGNDIFLMGNALDSDDSLDGGAGYNTVVLSGMGDVDTMVWSAGNFTGIDKVVLQPQGGFYDIVSSDENVAAHATLSITGSHIGSNDSLTFDGSAETDGHFNIVGGTGGDDLTGGQLSDVINLTTGGNDTAKGGMGADIIIGNSTDNETFVYTSAHESTGAGYDTILNVNFELDTFHVPWGNMANNFGFFAGGSLSTATFNSDLAIEVGKQGFGNTPHDAILYEPTSGDLVGHAFLVIDVNGHPGYQAGGDIVIDVTGFTGLEL
jgi:Ca2+-binding RTX toxin-like protein